MTSQNRRARAAGSSASSAWSSVVPERGSPVANTGRTTCSAAIGWRFRSSKNAETGGEEPVDRRGGRGLAGRRRARLARTAADDDPDPLGQRVVPVVREPGLALGAREERRRRRAPAPPRSWRRPIRAATSRPPSPAPSRPTGRRTPDPPSRCSRGSTRPGGPPRAARRSRGRPLPGVPCGTTDEDRVGVDLVEQRQQARPGTACRDRCPGCPASAHPSDGA